MFKTDIIKTYILEPKYYEYKKNIYIIKYNNKAIRKYTFINSYNYYYL